MKKLYLIAIASLFSTPLYAQQSINSHTFSFSDTLETVQIEDALGPNSELAQHRYLLHISEDFVNEPLIGIDPTRTKQEFSVVKKLYSTSMGAGFMITKRLLVGFELPIHYVRLGESYIQLYGLNGIDDNKWKFGDLKLHAKWRLTSDDSPVNAAIEPYVFFPTGSKDYFVSDDSYGFGGKLLVDATPIPFLTLYGNAGYTYASNAEFLNIDRSKRVELAAGAFVRVLPIVGINAEVINGITAPGYKKDQNPIAIRLGFRVKTGEVRWFAGGALEGIQTARSDDVSLYAGVKMPFGSWKEKKVVEPAPAPTPAPEVITVEKKIEILKENLSVRREINFETDKAVILPESYSELDSAAEIINKYAQYIGVITIEGHTDSRGSLKHNQILSEHRAESVKNYLVSKGVPAEKLKAIGYGKTRLKVKETSPETLLINRRVEFKVDETIETKKETDTSTDDKKK